MGDTAATFPVGEVSPDALKLIDVTREALERGIRQAVLGNHVGDIGHAIETYVKAHGFSVVKDYAGHGVGRSMHEGPSVPNYGKPGRGPMLRKGMVIAIEPMVIRWFRCSTTICALSPGTVLGQLTLSTPWPSLKRARFALPWYKLAV